MAFNLQHSLINYEHLLNNAMHSVVKEALRHIKNDALPGNHHFYVSFLTNYPGVSISNILKQRYPREITIVLQYQFKNLFIEEDQFSIALTFNGKKENIRVPYKALTYFTDPSVNLELKFTPVEDSSGDVLPKNVFNIKDKTDKHTVPEDNVISLDRFRKK